MPIFDEGYQNFEGEKRGALHRIVSIAWEGIKLQWPRRFRGWLFWILLLFPLAGILIFFGSIFFGMGYFHDPSYIETYRPMLEGFFGSEFVNLYENEPGKVRPFLWSFAFFRFYYAQLFIVIFIVAAIGPKLIAYDLRHEGLHLYFSKPVTITEYIVGKFLVIFTFIALFTYLPALGLYLISGAFTPHFGEILSQTYPILYQSFFATLAIAVPCALVILYFSSLSKSGRYLGFAWLGIWFFTSMASGVVEDTLNSRLFSLEISYKKLLSQKKVPDSLRKKLEKRGISLSQEAFLKVVETGKEWEVTDGDKKWKIFEDFGTLKIFPGSQFFDLLNFPTETLNQEEIPEALRKEFEKRDISLSKDAKIQVIQRDLQWRITDGGQNWVIVNAFDSIKIRPTSSVFAIEMVRKELLNQQKIPEPVRKEFEERKISLSKEARVQVLEADRVWKVTGGEKEWKIKNEFEKLNVYPGTPPDTSWTSFLSLYQNFGAVVYAIFDLPDLVDKPYLKPLVENIIKEFIFQHEISYSFLIVVALSLLSLFALVGRLRKKL